jgi:hypothetical protein
LDAWAKQDFPEARKYVSNETESVFDMLVGMKENAPKEPLEIVIGGINVDGDNATMSYLENGMEKELALVRLDKSWYVAFSKEGGGGMEELEKALKEALDSAAMDSL